VFGVKRREHGWVWFMKRREHGWVWFLKRREHGCVWREEKGAWMGLVL
jgi:hypothetical protein